MLHDLQLITNAYLKHKSSYQLGLSGIYPDENYLEFEYDYSYIDGLYEGGHFVLLEHIFMSDDLINNVYEDMMKPYTKEQFKFAKFLINNSCYEICMSYINEIGGEINLDMLIMLHERTLFLKKKEKQKREKPRQKRIKQEQQEREREREERQETITTPVYEVRSVSELIKSIPRMPKLT